MIELADELRRRTRDAIEALNEAQAEDDLHLTSIRLGELDSLARTADDHDLVVPELGQFRRACA